MRENHRGREETRERGKDEADNGKTEDDLLAAGCANS